VERYSLAEVYRLAEAIEKHGQEFYTQAAATAVDGATRGVLKHLADEESRHAGIFAAWRQQHCGAEDVHVVDLDEQVQGYLEAVAANHVFNLGQEVAELLGSVQSPESALRLALSFEKDTIVFFTALREAVPVEQREKVEQMIREELRHVRDLQKALNRRSEWG